MTFRRNLPRIVVLLSLLFFSLIPQLHAEETVVVEVVGLKGDLLKNVEASLTPPSTLVSEGVVNRRWLNHLLRKIPEYARQALEPLGYYNAEVGVELSVEPSGVHRIKLLVDQGDPVILTSVAIRLTGPGAEEPEIKAQVAEFPLQVGDVLRHDLYEEGRFKISVAADDIGYLQESWAIRTVRVYPERNEAEIELELDTGPIFFFGKITVNGPEVFPEEFLRRHIVFREGERFSPHLVYRTRLRFFRANRFDEVQVVPHIELAEDQHVPVEITLKEAPRRRLRPGVGYSTNTGARVMVNYRDMNIGHLAHSFRGELIYAEKYRGALFTYAIPQDRGANDNLLINWGYEEEDINTYENRVYFVEGEKTFGFGLDMVGSVFVRYFNDSYDIGDQSDKADFVMPGLRYYQRSYDDQVNPKKGFQFRLETRGALDILAEVNFIQFLGAGSFIFPFAETWTLLSRLEAASTVKDDPLSALPVSLRFFAGGDSSVRGYGYKSQGPKDAKGKVIGGDSLLVGSLEVEKSLTEDWGVSVFYDVGNAFDAFDNIRFVQGIGVGVRRYTVVGPVRIDLAYKINEDDNNFRIHIGMGFDL